MRDPSAPTADQAPEAPPGAAASATAPPVRRVADGRLSLIIVGAVTLAVLFVAGWNLSGGQLQVMETSSMCPSVCVGSLVGERPLEGPPHVGQLVTFHPPHSHGQTYTHEISHIFANGMIQTRGVGNPTHDPWLLTRSDIVGVGVFSVWGLGWLLRALPLLSVGVLAWVVLRTWIQPGARRAWDRVCVVGVAVLPVWVLHPLVSASVVATTTDPSHSHWLRMTVVNTGILPASFDVASGRGASHVGSAALARPAGAPIGHQPLILHEVVSLYWWGWVIVGIVVLSPIVSYAWHIWRDDEGVPTTAAL
ncbi:MAG TPA: hypothetical protein VND44_10605 [Acidimicrobiales bacterium]|nr:hypothetical protein [Acidimicrobiales bacterium]